MTDENLFKLLPPNISALILSKPEDADLILRAVKEAYVTSPSRPLLRFMALSYAQTGRDAPAIRCYEYEEENFGPCAATRMPMLSLYQSAQNWEKVFVLSNRPALEKTSGQRFDDEVNRELFLFFRRACLNLKRYEELVRYEEDITQAYVAPYKIVDEGILELWGGDASVGVDKLSLAISRPDVAESTEAYNFGVAHLALGLTKLKRYQEFLANKHIQNLENLAGLRAEIMFSTGDFSNLAWDLFERSYGYDIKRTHLWWASPELKVQSKSIFFQSANILVWGNQGIGDQLALVSALSRTLHGEQFSANVIIAIDKKILGVAKILFPKFNFAALDNISLIDFDFHYPLSSVLRFFEPETWISERIKAFKHLNTALNQGKIRVFVPTYSNKFKIIDIRSLAHILKNILPEDVFGRLTLVYGGYSLASKEEEIYMMTKNFIEYDPNLNYKDDVDEVAHLIETCDLTVGVANSYTILSGILGVSTIRLSAEPDTGLRFNLLENTYGIELNATDDINHSAAIAIRDLILNDK